MSTAIRIENLSKRYTLGLTHAGSIRELVNRTAARLLGRASKNSDVAGEHPSRVDAEGTFWALRDINLEIPTGKAIGIIGRNGAGKSTLLKILSRITHPTTGRIELYGRVASLLEVGTGFHPELTGRENVYLNGTILGMTRGDIRRRFDDIVEFAGIDRFIDTPVKRYSSGMKVRLGFAVAAHLEPEILIVDEVLAVGDVEFQQRCLGKMDEVANSGRTVLFVSHNMSTVRQLTADSIVLSDGRIEFRGTTENAIEVYTKGVMDDEQQNSIESKRRQSEFPGRAIIEAISFVHEEESRPEANNRTIDLVLRAEEYTGTIRVSITVSTAGGVPVGSAFSGQSIELSAGNATRAMVGLDTSLLAPGCYLLAVSIGTGDTTSGIRNFDTVANVLPFEIDPEKMTNGLLSTWRRGWGAIRLPSPEIVSCQAVEKVVSH